MTTTPNPFWKTKRLSDMSREDWESLCDGCGQCCLHKLEDADTGAIAMTDVACELLDTHTCRCGDYANRKEIVEDCVQLTPATVGRLPWLPETCAYRLVWQGEDLPDWHPLVSGSPDSVHEAGISVQDKVVSETFVDDLEDHVTRWLEEKVKNRPIWRLGMPHERNSQKTRR